MTAKQLKDIRERRAAVNKLDAGSHYDKDTLALEEFADSLAYAIRVHINDPSTVTWRDVHRLVCEWEKAKQAL